MNDRLKGVDLVMLAMLMVALVAIALGLIGVASRGTTPLVLIPAVAAAAFAITHLRE